MFTVKFSPSFFARLTLVVLASNMLGACSNLNELTAGDKVNYKAGLQTISPLELPPSLNAKLLDPNYVAPDSQTFSQFVKDREGGKTQVLQENMIAHIERNGNQRWLVVNAPADAVWLKLEKFWLDMGFKLEKKSPETGIMETNWLENKAGVPNDALRSLFSSLISFAFSADKKDKFRTRIERLSPTQTEVYVTHSRVEEQFTDSKKDTSKYYASAADPEVEVEILRKMILALGLNTTQANYLAQEYAKADKASLAIANSAAAAQNPSEVQSNTLTLNQDEKNAWRMLGAAIDRAAFKVEAKNTAEKSYTVSYLNPEQFNQQTSFWKRVTTGENADNLRRAKSFKIMLTAGTEDNTQVISVQDLQKDATLEKDTQSPIRIIRVLRENLSM